MNTLKFLKNLVVLSCVMLIPTLSYAAISVNSVSGGWNSTQGGKNVKGVGTSKISWGGNVGTKFRSNYVFQPTKPFLYDVKLGQTFELAKFIHKNGVIPIGSGITKGTLTTHVNLNIDGKLITKAFTFNFNHNETPNFKGRCLGGSLSTCDDRVSLANNLPIADTFILNGYQYSLSITALNMKGKSVTSFLTRENHKNMALIQAMLTRVKLPVEVPEPSTYLILGSTLALIFLIRRRKYTNLNLLSDKIKNIN